jgi:hypothetical protein
MLGTLISAFALEKAASPAITSALTHGGVGVAAPTNEPAAVAALTWVGTPAIAAAWSPILRPLGLALAMQGVFCHGSPQVSFSDSSGAPRSCELADLLIVVDDCTSGTIQDRRAVLVQAKLFSASRAISTAGTAAHQLDLYMRWPSFRFRSSAYGSAPRDFSAAGPGSVGESGRYGGIDLRPRPAVWEHLIPASSMTFGSGDQLSWFLSEMVAGSTAFGREAISGGKDDWSSTVDELLSVTASQSVTLTASLGPGGSRSRGESATASMVGQNPQPPSTVSLGIAGLPPDGIDVRETGPDGGISVLRVAIERLPLREEE